MKIDKEYFLNFIDIIYKLEKIFIGMINTYETSMKKVNQLSSEVQKLSSELPKDERVLKSSKDIKKLSLELLMFNKYIQKIQSGRISLFNWAYLDELKITGLKQEIKNSDLINWLSSKLDNNQKIIYSEISRIPFQVETNSVNKFQFTDFTNKITLKMNELLEDKERVYIFLNSPYDIVGKEITKVYFSFNNEDEVFIEQFNVRDFISYSLLMNEEEFDQDVLNNLRENNALSNIFKIAKENASTLDDINFLSLERDLSEIFLEKNLNKEHE